MTSVEILTLIVTLFPSVSALVVAVIAVFHSIAAKVQAQNNAVAHAANASAITSIGDKVHAIALALPSAMQAATPQLQAVAAVPQVASMLRYAAPAMQGVDEVLAAVKSVADQLQTLKPVTEEKVSATATGSSPLQVTPEEKKV